ncbi:signal peptidase [Bacillus niacini]|uniref:Signal peptidase I n=1 Tax=Neobacillus niacini TaxID=86668 RepID=A0A852T7R3_9BACI|nr:signal peptidase I [Neobacillus niacini]NYE03876.1 signal peptidase [Neobacillus niacini]
MIFDKSIIDLFKNIVRKDGFIELPSVGYSMFPFIRKGDICRFVPCDPQTLKKGDVVLFHSESGQLIAHRFSHSNILENRRYYFFKGDTNLGFDQPVMDYHIIGKLTSIQRLNKGFSIENPFFKRWGKLMLVMPLISGILRRYLIWRRLFHF